MWADAHKLVPELQSCPKEKCWTRIRESLCQTEVKCVQMWFFHHLFSVFILSVLVKLRIRENRKSNVTTEDWQNNLPMKPHRNHTLKLFYYLSSKRMKYIWYAEDLKGSRIIHITWKNHSMLLVILACFQLGEELPSPRGMCFGFIIYPSEIELLKQGLFNTCDVESFII